MGILDWFKRTIHRVQELPDVIWLTRQARLSGVASAVRTCLNDSSGQRSVFLVAHFETGMRDLHELARSAALEQPSLMITQATNLKPEIAAASGLDETRRVEIIVAERHLMRSHDESILEFARGLPCQSRVVFHVSLDDPLMRLFASEWVTNLLRTLGMKEDEPIESAMVSRRIKAAQKKLVATSSDDATAVSAEEWLQRNCPQHWRTLAETQSDDTHAN